MKKTPQRDRELAAIRHEVPDRIPVDAIAVENAEAVAAYSGIEQKDVYRYLGCDGRLVSIGYNGDPATGTQKPERNEWGALSGAAYGSAHVYPLAGVTEPAAIDRYAWPDTSRYDYAAAARTAKDLATEYAVRGPYWQPLFCRVCSLTGMETALLWMLRDPHLFEAALEAVFQRVYALCDDYVRHCGRHLDILCLGDDFASQRGMMFSPELWRKFLKPRYARLFEIGKAAGKFVWFHSCGDITAVLPDLIDIGMDVWETVQLHTLPVSAEELKRDYGKHITFFGGVNTQKLPFRTPTEVADDVNRCIDALGAGGGYICGPDHHLRTDVPPANTVALFETACTYRGRGYTSERTQISD